MAISESIPKVARNLRAHIRRLAGGPYDRRLGRPQIIHLAHHRAGTLWFSNLLGHVAHAFALTSASGSWQLTKPDADIVVLWDALSMFEPDRPWRGSHMIRDPRDMVVSGYHYHQWSDERWLHEPRADFDGQTYQEKLKSLNESDGLTLEIEQLASWCKEMTDWNYSRPEILELRYEDVIQDEQRHFRRLFEHYGFTPRATRLALRIAERHSLNRVGTGERTHMRSGESGQWRTAFTTHHRELFKQKTGDLLFKLGYERDDQW